MPLEYVLLWLLRTSKSAQDYIFRKKEWLLNEMHPLILELGDTLVIYVLMNGDKATYLF